MTQYDHEHSSGWNKLLHGIGIPMIFAGLILFLFAKWIWAGTFFVGRWVLLFLGHRVEGNRPAFFQGLVHLLVGPTCIAQQACTFLTGQHPPPPPETTRTKQSQLSL